MRGFTQKIAFSVAISACAAWGTVHARVTKLETVNMGAAFEGRSFGDIGAYERLDAIAHFAVNPNDPALREIVHLKDAPVNADGEVEFSTQVTIMRPEQADKRSSVLFYEVANRGRSHAMVEVNLGTRSAIPRTAKDAGDGFLMAQGNTLVWSGWQSDIGGELIHLNAPVAAGVTGLSREEKIFEKLAATGEIELSYPIASQDLSQAHLYVRQHQGDARTELKGAFRYLDSHKVQIDRPDSMDAGAIYEFVYPAKDPVVQGLGFVATRDLIAFLRDDNTSVARPVEGIDTVLAFGISQSGRFLRDFIAQGFNADEQGRKVFDGAFINVAGSRKTMLNAPFAQPGRYSRQHEDHDWPGDEFPFSYAETTDAISGQSGSVLSACEKTQTCPKIMHTDSSTEFWQARAYLVNTSTDGSNALPMPSNVRLYAFSSAPHFNQWAADAKAVAVCAAPVNPISQAPAQRALLLALTDWVKHDKAPPASVFPSVADGSLVAVSALVQPQIAGAVAQPLFNQLNVKDYRTQPPTKGAAYPQMVPRIDALGHEEGGVRMPFVAVPLATYTGWNMRKTGYAAGDLCNVNGGAFALPATAQEGDSRPALDVLYPLGLPSYLAQVNRAVTRLVQQGFVLEQDRALIQAEALRQGKTAFALPQ